MDNPPEWLLGLIRYVRFFFVVNGVACVLLVFGLASAVNPRSKGVVLRSILAVGLGFITMMVRLLTPLS